MNEAKTYLELLEELLQKKDVELSQLAWMPPSSEEIKKQMRSYLTSLATKGQPNFIPAMEDADTNIKFPHIFVDVPVITEQGFGVCNLNIPDVLGMFCWLFKDQLSKKMAKHIDWLADEENSLPEPERLKRLNALDEEMGNIRRTIAKIKSGKIRLVEE